MTIIYLTIITIFLDEVASSKLNLHGGVFRKYGHLGLFEAKHKCLKKNQNTPRPSEYPPVMGEKMSKRLGGIKRLQIQNLFMAFKQVPRCR